MWRAAADRNGHPRCWLPSGSQSEWHWKSVKEAHLQQRPTEYPKENRHEESGYYHLSTAAVLQELHGSTRGNTDSIQRLPP